MTTIVGWGGRRYRRGRAQERGSHGVGGQQWTRGGRGFCGDGGRGPHPLPSIRGGKPCNARGVAKGRGFGRGTEKGHRGGKKVVVGGRGSGRRRRGGGRGIPPFSRGGGGGGGGSATTRGHHRNGYVTECGLEWPMYGMRKAAGEGGRQPDRLHRVLWWWWSSSPSSLLPPTHAVHLDRLLPSREGHLLCGITPHSPFSFRLLLLSHGLGKPRRGRRGRR